MKEKVSEIAQIVRENPESESENISEELADLDQNEEI
jgi:hypothetical protein